MQSKKIKKAVIAAAGLGTRFLPATKAMPKEMLTVIDKPVIQYVVEDLVEAGIEDIVIVTGWHKRNIEDHFDYPFELEKRLEEAGKYEEVEKVRRIAEMANFIYIRQKGPYGNGTPFLNARAVIGDEPFIATWGDEFYHAAPSRSKQLVDVYERFGNPCVSAVKVTDPIALSKYGVADVVHKEDNIYKIKQVIEKPAVGEAPSNIATCGAYLLTPRIFDILETLPLGKNNELWLMDAITILAKETDIYAVEIQNARYYDTGNKLEYLKTVVEMALRHPELKDDFANFLKQCSL